MTTITDANIKNLVKQYLTNKDNLPNDLRHMPIGNWNVSGVTNMTSLFAGAKTFNEPIGNWDVSNVTNMTSMFLQAKLFNQPLDKWKTGNVRTMESMFYEAESFNQPLEDWDVSNVTNMRYMFFQANNFNGSLNGWKEKTKKVKNMTGMFYGAVKFNKPIDDWDVSSVTKMENMFMSTNSFNQPLNKWKDKTKNVKSMDGMFCMTLSFNQPIGDWDVSNVEDMTVMFKNAERFNQPLNEWKVDKVKYMTEMFCGAFLFNQPLDKWNVSNVVHFSKMFAFTNNFNQNLNRWSVNARANTQSMFEGSQQEITNYPDNVEYIGDEDEDYSNEDEDYSSEEDDDSSDIEHDVENAKIFNTTTGNLIKTRTFNPNTHYKPQTMEFNGFPVSSYKVPHNAQYFDAYESDHINISQAESEIIIFKVGNELYGATRENINKQMHNGSYIKYECLRVDSLADRNLVLKTPYFLFRSLGTSVIGVVSFFDMWNIIKEGGLYDKGHRMYEFASTDKKLLTTVSHTFKFAKTRHEDYDELRVSSSHCQPGQEERVYEIKIMNMKEKTPRKSPTRKMTRRSPRRTTRKSHSPRRTVKKYRTPRKGKSL